MPSTARRTSRPPRSPRRPRPPWRWSVQPREPGRDAPKYSFGGVGISCTDMKDAVDALFRTARDGSGGYYAFTCAHGIVDSQKDERLRTILNGSRYTMPDGMPTVWLGKMKGQKIARVTAPDFFETVMADPRAKTI